MRLSYKSPFVVGRISLRPGVFRCLYSSTVSVCCQAFFKIFLKIFFRFSFLLLSSLRHYSSTTQNGLQALFADFFDFFSPSLFCTNDKPVLPFKLYRLHKSLLVLYRYNKKPSFGKSFQIEGLKILPDFTNFGNGKGEMKGIAVIFPQIKPLDFPDYCSTPLNPTSQ